MNLPTRARYTLKEIFELRSVQSVAGRRCSCRLFLHKGQIGAFDVSGTLWPIAIQAAAAGKVAESECQAGDWVELCFSAPFKDSLACAAKFGGNTRMACSLSGFAAPEAGSNVFWDECLRWLGDLDERGCFDLPGFTEETAADRQNMVFTTLFIASSPFQKFRHHQTYQSIKCSVAQYFRGQGYLELEAPLLVKSGGIEMYLNPFRTKYTDHSGAEHSLEMPTSPEFSLKKLLAQGYPRVFSLAQTFRNHGESSHWHRPQFCMLEWYTVGQSLDELIAQTFDVVRCVARRLAELGNALHTTNAAEKLLALNPLRFRIEDLYAQYFNLDLGACMHDEKRFYTALKSKSVSVLATDSFDTLFWKSFLDVIEPEVLKNQCVVICGFPARFAALAAPEPNGLYAERFELFINGVEICNGYYELTDVAELRARFAEICARRPETARDLEFEAAMEFGMPAASGNALGLERLISVLHDRKELTTGHGLGPF